MRKCLDDQSRSDPLIPFIRSVQAAPEPLADYQLNDIERVCTNY